VCYNKSYFKGDIMSKKLKYKEKTGLYRLNLTHAEVELIAALVQHVRLGNDDTYHDAALNLCEVFGETEDFDCNMLDGVIHIGSSLDAEGDTTIEANEKSQAPCRGGCKGCSCSD
jgi:hypothetical protein